MATLVCVPIMVHDAAQALADAGEARDAGADMVELRIDECFTGAGMTGEAAETDEVRLVLGLVEACPLPCIVTCRSAAEGGHYEGDESARVSLYERLGTHDKPPRYIDMECAAYSRSANVRQKINLAVDHPGQQRDVRTGLILSAHDFSGRPADLSRRVAAMAGEPACNVVKVAYRARSLRDNLELLELPGHSGRPTIALGMGEFGVMSRVLAPKFGGFLTFASLRAAGATAPGQPTLRELLEVYRFRAIGAATRVYGVIGWPVTHSLSPHVHNAGFEAVGHDGVYVPMPVAAGEDREASYLSFKATVLEMLEHEGLGLAGCSVTMPHKENLARLAREQKWEVGEATGATGAANTLVVAAGGKAAVMNTDAAAVAACLRGAVGKLAGARVGVIGAGGVARAAAYAMLREGATVVVYNRGAERARALAESLARFALEGQKIVACEASLLVKACCDVFINCTPLGMAGGPEPLASTLPAGDMQACPRVVTVLETVYEPPVTPTLLAAGERGWKTVDGVAMFVEQAALQFEAWTGVAAPARLFERVARETLALRAGRPGAER